MKKNIFNFLKALSACAVGAAFCVSAQAESRLIAKVPFDFVVSNSRLAAGDYTLDFDHGQSIVLLRSENGESAVLVLCMAAHSGKITEQAKLVFKQYGNRYVLSQVWPAGSNDGREFPQSKMERELASSTGKPEIVSLLISGSGVRKPAR